MADWNPEAVRTAAEQIAEDTGWGVDAPAEDMATIAHDLLAALENVVARACTNVDGTLTSWGNGDYAAALRLLAKHGKAEIAGDDGERHAMARWRR